MIMHKKPQKNYTQWKCDHYFHSFDSLINSNTLKNNGIHTVNNGGYEIDLYANNIDCVDDSLPLLVFFNGAVSNREDKTGPFFSGLNISNKLGLPSLSFSDPTVDNIRELNLAWYTGSLTSLDLRERIISIIKIFHCITNRNIILLGGSGGGFAALSIADSLTCPALAIVWNPQTSISLYDKEAVSRYLKLALNCPVETDVYQFLSEKNIVHDLCYFRNNNHSRILYLQNITDWHLKSHALPYANSQNYKIIRNNGHWQDNLSIYLGDFGTGHAAPTRDILDKIITLYAGNLGSSIPDGYIASEEIDSMPFIFSVDDFDITVTNEGFDIIVSTKITSRYPFRNPLFAFYIIHDGIKDIQPYSKNNIIKINPLSLKSKEFQVQAFIFDDGHRCVKTIDLKA